MFKDRDVICFLGDSITAAGLWMAEIYQILRKRIKVKCYNCGVPGGIAKKARGYLYEECLVYNPDYVVLMFGMNDLARDLYSENNVGNTEVDEKKRFYMKRHLEYFEAIVKECIAHGSEVIICTPTPYDEINDLGAEKLLFQSALAEAKEHHIALAEKYGCKVIDFQSVILELLESRKLISDDRVHPTPECHHIMAQLFLKGTGEIEKCDFDTPFELEEWNKERYDAEKEDICLNYVKLCDLYEKCYETNMTEEETKAVARQKYEEWENKEEYVPRMYLNYIEKAHIREKIRGEVIKRTIF